MTATIQGAPTDPAGAPARKLTGDQYMELLLARQAEFMAQYEPRPGAKALLAPTLETFVRAGDEDLVELPEPPPKRVPAPRRYRPASFWRGRVQALDAQMAAVSASVDLGDRAAAGGVGLGPKRNARHRKRMDAALQRYVALKKHRDHAEMMLRSATARGQKQGD